MNRNRITLWVAFSFLLLPLLAVLVILGWFALSNASAGQIVGFLLLFGPGIVLFLAGSGLGLTKWRDPSRRLLAIRVRIVGRILFYLIPDLWFVGTILAGTTSPVAWPVVVFLTVFGALQVVVLTGVRMPEQASDNAKV